MVGTVTEALRHIKAELATLLDAPVMLALCHEVGDQGRARLLDPVTTIHRCILQILHGNTAWSHLPHLVAQPFTASAFCQARTRLPLGVWQRLLRQTAAVCEQTAHDEGRWRGHRTFLVDGSSCSMPDVPELQEYFGQPSGQRPGCGFPVAHLLALFQAGTGFLLEALAAPWHTHDMAQVASCHATLCPWMGGTRAPARAPAGLDDARTVDHTPGGTLCARPALPRSAGRLSDPDRDVGDHPPGGRPVSYGRIGRIVPYALAG